MVEQSHVLERPPDADLGNGVPGPIEDRLPLKQHVAAVWRVEPAQAVEESGLTGSIGADEAGDLAGKNVEGDAVEGDDAAEPDGHVTHAEKRRAAG